MSSDNKTRLSKSILEMKFMKRSKEKVEKEQFQEEGEEYFGNHLLSHMKNQTGQFIVEPSFVFCEELIEGRVSFQGMNPEIERIMELEKLENVQEEVKNETEVSDSEMADRFRKLKKFKADNPRVKSSHKKWTKNNELEPLNKKPKFLKPEE